MVLNYDKDIRSLENCPLENDDRTIKLYRLALSSPMTNEDLKPLAFINPKVWGKNCRAWGLSFHTNIEGSKNTLKILNKKKKANRTLIVYSLEVDKDCAIKHQSSDDKSHYTVYPYSEVDVLSKFALEII